MTIILRALEWFAYLQQKPNVYTMFKCAVSMYLRTPVLAPIEAYYERAHCIFLFYFACRFPSRA